MEENRKNSDSQGKSVFYLSTPEQLFVKFWWELDNLRNTVQKPNGNFNRDHELAAYHAFNAAVTVWHLTDWTWKFLSKEQSQLAVEFGFKLTDSPQDNLKAFQKALRQKSRALEICWELANGSKHLERHKNSNIDTKVKVGVKHATAGELRAGQPLQTISYDFIVHWKSQSLRIVDIFEEAKDFWASFLTNKRLIGEIMIQTEISVTVTRNK